MPSFRTPSFRASATALATAATIATLAACSAAAPTVPTPAATPTTAAASPAAGDSIEVTGVDYAFEGMPEEVPAGTTLSFQNGGSEIHEMVVMRRNDDVAKPFMEILGEGEEAARTQVAILGAAAAPPGQDGQAGVAVGEAGDYAIVCFIPVGTTPGASGAPGGPPHFVQGMITEFAVSD